MRVLLCLILICPFLMPATSFALDVNGIILLTHDPDADSEDDYTPQQDVTVQGFCERPGSPPYRIEKVSNNDGLINFSVSEGPCTIRLIYEGTPSTVESIYFEQADESFLLLFLDPGGEEGEWFLSAYVE